MIPSSQIFTLRSQVQQTQPTGANLPTPQTHQPSNHPKPTDQSQVTKMIIKGMAIIGRITSQTTPTTPKVHAVAGMQDTSADVGWRGESHFWSKTEQFLSNISSLESLTQGNIEVF